MRIDWAEAYMSALADVGKLVFLHHRKSFYHVIETVT